MVWVWSDELAGAFEAAGAAKRSVAQLRRCPVAVAVPDGEDPVAWAAVRLGIEISSGDDHESRDDAGPFREPGTSIESSL